MLSSILKTGRVLDFFTESTPEWGATQVAAAIGTSKSNAHAILSSLEAIHLLQRTESGRYRLGWRSFALACQIGEMAVLKDHGIRYLSRLAAVTGETTHLGVHRGNELFFLARVAPPHGVKPKAGSPGSSLPAHLTASGRMLLGALPAPELASLLSSGPLPRLTRRTATDPAEVLDRIEEAQMTGCAVSVDEAIDGVAQLAVPVFDAAGAMIAAVGVSMPTERLDAFRSTQQRKLATAARNISRAVRAQVAAPT